MWLKLVTVRLGNTKNAASRFDFEFLMLVELYDFFRNTSWSLLTYSWTLNVQNRFKTKAFDMNTRRKNNKVEKQVASEKTRQFLFWL